MQRRRPRERNPARVQELERSRRHGELLDDSAFQADWSVPWADLMMVMFVLFAVLFAYELAERDLSEAFEPATAGAVAAPAASDPSGPSVYEQSAMVVRDADLEDVELELQADDSVKLSVRGPLLFDLGKAELKPPTRKFLEQLARVIGSTEYAVHVIGHTDTFPVSNELFPTNWELSAYRATAVTRYLIGQGLEPERFTVMGHSMYRPEVANRDPVSKARNRRVEIVITRNRFRRQEAG